MPCYEADSEANIRRIDEPLTPSTGGVWILSHVDLRSTARVRVCREFVAEIILDKQSLILGKRSKFAWEACIAAIGYPVGRTIFTIKVAGTGVWRDTVVSRSSATGTSCACAEKCAADVWTRHGDSR